MRLTGDVRTVVLCLTLSPRIHVNYLREVLLENNRLQKRRLSIIRPVPMLVILTELHHICFDCYRFDFIWSNQMYQISYDLSSVCLHIFSVHIIKIGRIVFKIRPVKCYNEYQYANVVLGPNKYRATSNIISVHSACLFWSRFNFLKIACCKRIIDVVRVVLSVLDLITPETEAYTDLPMDFSLVWDSLLAVHPQPFNPSRMCSLQELDNIGFVRALNGTKISPFFFF